MEDRYHPLGNLVLRITENAVPKILRYSGNVQKLELNDCVKELNNCYSSSSLYHGEADVEFDDPRYQACYVFLYFPVLCYGTYEGLKMCEEHLRTVLEKASLESCLKVCALGGGPGTDLFGVRMFLNDFGHENVTIKGTVLDKHPNWRYAFDRLSSQINVPSSLSAEYLRLEIGSPTILPEHIEDVLSDVNIITCSKFVSAVRTLHNSKETLVEVLKHVKPDTFIFYMDNSKGRNTDFFSSVAKRVNCALVASFERGENDPFQLPETENSRILQELSSREWFNFKSQRNLRVTFMLWKKLG